MLYGAETRSEMVERRTDMLRRKKERRLTFMLAMLCLLIAGSLVVISGFSSGSGHGYVPGLYGATMLWEDAGGYVLTGVLAFAAAVIITVLCICCREKSKAGH